MNYNSIKKVLVFSVFTALYVLGGNSNQKQPMKVAIITASVRSTTTGETIAKNIKAMLGKRADISVEIINLKEYSLPLYTEAIAPGDRKDPITDPVLKRWSDTIQSFDGYIIVSPEYNAGYPASLKNALDSLYVEWNNKPVALVGYSGGPSGGAAMLAQVRQILPRFKMLLVAHDIKIPYSWKAFDKHGNLVDADRIEKEFKSITDQLVQLHCEG